MAIELLGRGREPNTLRKMPPRFGNKVEIKPPKRFADLKTKSDPKPRYGWFNVRNVVIASLGFLGFWNVEKLGHEFHHWADSQAAVVKKVHNTHPVELPPKAPLEAVRDVALDNIAQTDHVLHHTKYVGYMMDLYLNIFTWEALTIAILATMAARKRTIYPSQLWAELNKRGLTGENMKVAVIDTGGKPKTGVRKDKITVITPNDRKTGLSWVVPGSHFANVIAQASPDSNFFIFPVLTRSNAKEILKKTNEYYKKAKDNPELLDIQEIRKIYQPVVLNIANAIRKAVDEGVDVVHVSYNLEQAALVYLFSRMTMTYVDNGWLKVKKLFQGKAGRAQTQSKLEKNRNLIEKAKAMFNEKKRTDAVSEELKTLYQPLKEALDYAYKNEVPVVIGAGNYGGHRSTRADAIGNLNPLTIFHHPGLIIVGSTDSKKEVWPYTSEYNDLVRPYISANGGDEVKTDDAGPLKRPWKNKFLFPLGSLVMKYWQGLSVLSLHRPLWVSAMSPFSSIGMQMVTKRKKGSDFAAPDVTLLYLKMKQIDPSITIEEAKGIMLEASDRAKFSPAYMEELKKEIVEMKEVSVRNFRQGFVENIWTGLHCAVKTPGQAITIPDTLGDIRFEATGNAIRLHFESREDQEKADLALSTRDMAQKDSPTFRKLWNWVGEILNREDAKLHLLSGHKLEQKLLQMELGRRTGHRTIEGNRQKAIALTEERARLKQEAYANKTCPDKPENEWGRYPWVAQEHFLLNHTDFVLNWNEVKNRKPVQVDLTVAEDGSMLDKTVTDQIATLFTKESDPSVVEYDQETPIAQKKGAASQNR